MTFRTDTHNNPTAFTTDIAREAGLVVGIDYVVGDVFPAPSTLHTARLLGDPVAITIKVIDKIGFYNALGRMRWVYIAVPKFIWDGLGFDQKKRVIAFMFQHEGGVQLKGILGLA